MKIYTYRDLLERLCDLKALAKPPLPGERTANFSPYDRACQYDPETDTYLNWGQKSNCPQPFLRMEGNEAVVMEQEGPGVIWRIWGIHTEQATMRIYLDGSKEPILEQNLFAFFRRHGDEYTNMNFPNLVYTEKSRGHVSWLPIPFQKHIKITLEPFTATLINYSLFPKDSVLPSYGDCCSRENCIAKAETDRRLEDRGRLVRGKRWERCEITIPAGETATLCQKAGSGAVSGIRYYPELPSDCDEAEYLRKLAVSLYWDGREKPAVWAPLGDFFGSAMEIGCFRTLPVGMNDAACYSDWYMPYGEGMKMCLENHLSYPVTMCFDICFEALETVEAEKLLRFHAKWHRDQFLNLERKRFEKGGDRWPDWPILLAKGPGRYCGVNLHVYHDLYMPEEKPKTWWIGSWNPMKNQGPLFDWFWGEGREKFFIDGEKFPSTFGNGTEDYMGFAYSAEPPFPRWDSPFAAVTNIPINSIGHIAQCCFHIADNYPFQERFDGFIEKFKPNEWGCGSGPDQFGNTDNRCYYAATAFWYQQAGSDDDYPIPSSEELYGFYHLPPRSHRKKKLL